MASFDCFVSFSMGEGFSLIPREFLAMGIPCVLSNNTAHETICNTGLVKSVLSNILVKAEYFHLSDDCGYHFDTRLDDAVLALKDIYNNYHIYLNKAFEAREWAKTYSINNLKNKYLNLIKPKKLLYGVDNVITDDYLMTNSLILYKKYLSLE